MQSLIQQIRNEIKSNKSEKTRISTLKFVPSAVKVYGVSMPVLNELAHKHKVDGFDLIETLWKGGYYEERMLAAKILGLVAKQNPDKSVSLIKLFSKDLADWATCDCVGMQSPKKILKEKQEELFELAATLSNSKSLWQRRLSIVLLQNYCKNNKLHIKIKNQIKGLRKDKEYYVIKAIQWIDRDLEKRRG